MRQEPPVAPIEIPPESKADARLDERWSGLIDKGDGQLKPALPLLQYRQFAPQQIGVADVRETVEHPFGTIKQWMNQGAFLMRGLEKVRGEFSLTALAYNLRRVLNITKFAQLMAAVQS